MCIRDRLWLVAFTTACTTVQAVISTYRRRRKQNLPAPSVGEIITEYSYHVLRNDDGIFMPMPSDIVAEGIMFSGSPYARSFVRSFVRTTLLPVYHDVSWSVWSDEYCLQVSIVIAQAVHEIVVTRSVRTNELGGRIARKHLVLSLTLSGGDA